MYTTKELAKKLGYKSDAVIRKMIADKKLKASKIAHIWVIDESDIINNAYILDRIKYIGGASE